MEEEEEEVSNRRKRRPWERVHATPLSEAVRPPSDLPLLSSARIESEEKRYKVASSSPTSSVQITTVLPFLRVTHGAS